MYTEAAERSTALPVVSPPLALLVAPPSAARRRPARLSSSSSSTRHGLVLAPPRVALPGGRVGAVGAGHQAPQQYVPCVPPVMPRYNDRRWWTDSRPARSMMPAWFTLALALDL